MEGEVVLVDISAMLRSDTIKELLDHKCKTLLIPKETIAYFDYKHQKGESKGSRGIKLLQKLYDEAERKGVEICEIGEIPEGKDYKFLSEESLSIAGRKYAKENNCALFTKCRKAYESAKAQNIKVNNINSTNHAEYRSQTKTSTTQSKTGIEHSIKKVERVEKYLTDETMSLHAQAGKYITAKRGRPGEWKLVLCDHDRVTEEEIENFVEEAINGISTRVETKTKNMLVLVQNDGENDRRIVVIRPPLATSTTITISKNCTTKNIKEYALPKEVEEKIKQSTGGILIAGGPGEGKTTFCAALAAECVKKGKVLYTVESPRDLIVPETVVQISRDQGSEDELRKTLLLSRPDAVIFDEMRSPEDTKLYADLRLAGIGLIGVIHAERAVDAVLRMLEKIDIGTLPHIVDTILFIKGGELEKVLELHAEVKVPEGIEDNHQARPVVIVSDLLTGKAEYEVYSYGEGKVLVRLNNKKKGLQELARAYLEKFLEVTVGEVKVTQTSNTSVTIEPSFEAYQHLITSKEVQEIKERFGIDCTLLQPRQTQNKHNKQENSKDKQVQNTEGAEKKSNDNDKNQKQKEQQEQKEKELIRAETQLDEKYVTVTVQQGIKMICVCINKNFLCNAKVSDSGTVKFKRTNLIGAALKTALEKGAPIQIYQEE